VADVGGRLGLHSHLLSINSKAYSRFIDEHLLARIQGPSQTQIALTNACSQNCDYCYNKRRTGTPYGHSGFDAVTEFALRVLLESFHL